VYAILVGVMMITQWTVSILKRKVPLSGAEQAGARGRIEMVFHWAAEFATAAMLIAGGSGLLMQNPWGLTLYLVALGMLIYTVTNSPGYFAQLRQWPMVFLFAGLLVLAIISLLLVT